MNVCVPELAGIYNPMRFEEEVSAAKGRRVL
jgi:hypothetical protein